MAAPTNVRIDNSAQQFRGVFTDIRRVVFDLDQGLVASNSVVADVVPVPGALRNEDIVIGWTHETPEAGHEVLHQLRVDVDGELHVVSHNISAGPVTIAPHRYHVIIGRLLTW